MEERNGADFWWIDSAAGAAFDAAAGLDPLWGLEPPALPRFRSATAAATMQRTQHAPAHLLALRSVGLAPATRSAFSGDTRRDVGVSLKFQRNSTACASATSATAGGATTSAATCSATVTRSWRSAGTPAGRVQPDQPSAFHRFAASSTAGAVELPRRCGTCDDVRAACAMR